MYHSWIKVNRLSQVCEKRFLEFAERKLFNSNEIFYFPCVIYKKKKKNENKVICNHLCCDGISQHYTIQVWHGEVHKNQNATSHKYEVDVDMDDQLEDMIHDIE